jgi:hypothetical protein
VNEVNKEEKKPLEGFWYRIRKAFAIDSTKGRMYPKGWNNLVDFFRRLPTI